MTIRNLRIPRDRNSEIDMTILQEDETPYDLTGLTVYFTAKWNPRDANASAVFVLSNGAETGITLTDADDGQIRVAITPAKLTSVPYYEVSLYYDLVVKDGTSYYDAGRGRLTVLPNVYRSS